MNNPWLGDKFLKLSTWNGLITVFYFELDDQDQLVLRTIDLQTLEVLKTVVINNKIRDRLEELVTFDKCGFISNIEKKPITCPKSALLNTFLATCRFIDG